MSRSFIGSIATVFLVAASLSTGSLSAAAAPPTDPWVSGAGGSVAAVDLDAAAVSVRAEVGLASVSTDSQGTPRAVSTSQNLDASAAGIGIAVSSNEVTAAPAAGDATKTLAAASAPSVLSLGVMDAKNEAHWGPADACITDGVLSSAQTSAAEVSVLPEVAGGVAQVGATTVTSSTQLVSNSDSNYGVASTAIGETAGLSLLGGTVTVEVDGPTTVSATATGTAPGSTLYIPAKVFVATESEPRVEVTEALPAEVSVLAGTVKVELQTPTVSTTATTASIDSVLAKVTISTPLNLVTGTIDLLPMQASATVPAGGIDCDTDPVTPDAPEILVPASGAVVPASTEISGTGDPGATVEVMVDEAPAGTATVDEQGEWQISPEAPLEPGPHTTNATQELDGDISPPSERVPFTVEEPNPDAPTAPVVNHPIDGSMTADSTPTFDGTGGTGDTIDLVVDGDPIGETVVDENGDWSFTPTESIADGPHHADATATDESGARSDATPVDFTIATSVDELDPPVITAPENRSVVHETRPTFAGTGVAGATAEVFVDGDPIGTTQVGPEGTWSVVFESPLDHGVHVVTAQQSVDPTISELSDPVSFALLDHEPVPPVITSPTDGLITRKHAIVFEGTGEPYTLLQLGVSDQVWETVVGADGQWQSDPITLPDGYYESIAVETIPSPRHLLRSVPALISGKVGFTIDSVAPDAPVIVTPESGATDVDPTADISGDGDPGTTITVIIDGETAGTTVVDDEGHWHCEPNPALTPGEHEVEANASDAAGNTSESDSVSFTVPEPVNPTPGPAPAPTPDNGGNGGNGNGGNGGNGNKILPITGSSPNAAILLALGGLVVTLGGLRVTQRSRRA